MAIYEVRFTIDGLATVQEGLREQSSVMKTTIYQLTLRQSAVRELVGPMIEDLKRLFATDAVDVESRKRFVFSSPLDAQKSCEAFNEFSQRHSWDSWLHGTVVSAS